MNDEMFEDICKMRDRLLARIETDDLVLGEDCNNLYYAGRKSAYEVSVKALDEFICKWSKEAE